MLGLKLNHVYKRGPWKQHRNTRKGHRGTRKYRVDDDSNSSVSQVSEYESDTDSETKSLKDVDMSVHDISRLNITQYWTQQESVEAKTLFQLSGMYKHIDYELPKDTPYLAFWASCGISFMSFLEKSHHVILRLQRTTYSITVPNLMCGGWRSD